MYAPKVRAVEGRIADCSPLEAAVDVTSNEDTSLVHRRGVCTLAVMPRLDEQDAESCILRIQLNGLEIWKHSCSLCTESIIDVRICFLRSASSDFPSQPSECVFDVHTPSLLNLVE